MSLISEVTCVIKSFRRPKSLEKLYKSIRDFYPNIKIVVVDDSGFDFEPLTKSMKKAWDNDENLVIDLAPFDIGLSAGRNRALQLVETPFFVLLDDDFSFLKETKLETFLEYIKTYNLDLLGGCLLEGKAIRGMYKTMELRDGILYNHTAFYKKHDDKVYITDKVYNFFMARTATIKSVGWDNRLKLCEHTHFFLKCKTKNLSIGFTPHVLIQHDIARPNDEYKKYRNRCKDTFEEILKNEWNIKEVKF